MLHVLLRTFIMYALVVIAMRLMGKRQIGQLELSELVTITMLSELATASVADEQIPFLHCAAAIVLIVILEIGISYLTIKSRLASRLFDGTPSAVIFKGKLSQKELAKARITLGELVASMRSQGIFRISDVNYAFLESNGGISFVPKKCAQQPSVAELGLKATEDGVEHVIIMDGEISSNALQAIGKNMGWLDTVIKKEGYKKSSEIFFMGCDDNGNVEIIAKER